MSDSKKTLNVRFFDGLTRWIWIALGICFLAALISEYSTEFIIAGVIALTALGVIAYLRFVRPWVRARQAQANQP